MIDEGPWAQRGKEAVAFARKRAELNRRGGPRALGFQPNFYNHPKKTTLRCQVFTKLIYTNE